MHDSRYRKHERLRRRSDIARVFANRCSASDDVLIVQVAPNDLEWSRLALSVSRRIGNAVCRNFVRRRIREAFRTCKGELPRGLDVVCIARPAAKDSRRDVARSLCSLLGRLKVRGLEG